jgi:hypothetical protein
MKVLVGAEKFHLTLQKLIPKTSTKSSHSMAVDAMEAEFNESPLMSGNVDAMEAEFTESALMSDNYTHKLGPAPEVNQDQCPGNS